MYQFILTVEGQNLQAVDPNFTYLGCTPSTEVFLDAEFNNRIA